MNDELIPTGGILSGKEDFLFHIRLSKSGMIEVYVDIEGREYGIVMDAESISKLDAMIYESYRRRMT